MKFTSLFILLLLVLLAGNCNLHKPDVQQGNVVSKEMVNNLKVGMDKSQVRYVLGSPLLEDPFHPNRWDYVYSLKKANKKRQLSRITIHFKNEKVDRFETFLDKNLTSTENTE